MAGIRFPKDFETRMIETLGDNWAAFASSHDQPSPVSVRLNPGKPFHTYTQPVPWTKYGFYLPDRPSFTLDPLFHAGCFYVQEASSMFLEQAILQATNVKASLNVLDLSAAPGGKSTHLLSLISRDSLLVSNEVIRTRANILSENIQKWGHDNVIVTNNDPNDFQRLPGFFDVIVVDAPCSGEGLFRKDREAMDHWSTDNVNLCARRQKRILEDIWPALKEGGILIYSTCTYNHSENEENLKWLKDQQDAEPVSLERDSQWNIEATGYDGIHGYRFYPHRVEGEGFFIALMRKTSPQKETVMRRQTSLMKPEKKIIAQLTSWIGLSEEKLLFNINDLIRFFPQSKINELELIMKNLYIIHAGTAIASMKHDKIVPEHAAALSLFIEKNSLVTIPLELDQALQFLRKEALPLESTQRGFALVTYNEVPLGWVNILPNRLNNLYPSEWRIRMQAR